MIKELMKKAFNITLTLNDLTIKDFENKKPSELTEDDLKELDTLLTRCNEIIKKEG